MAPQDTWLPGSLVRRPDYSVSTNPTRTVGVLRGSSSFFARPNGHFGRDPYVTHRVYHCGRLLVKKKTFSNTAQAAHPGNMKRVG